MRSALISGIFSCGASRSFQSVVLPLPLWPARTNAVGLLLPATACDRSLDRPGGRRHDFLTSL